MSGGVRHTPGPWRIAPARDYRDQGEINIDAGERGLKGYICKVGMRDDPQAHADAHLIATAPDYDAFATHMQWEVIMGALDKWSKEGGSELVALGIIGSGLLKLDELRRAALAKARGDHP